MRNKLLLFIIAFFILGCTNERAINEKWKYQAGYHLGDWLDFEKNITISNDIIYKNDSALVKFLKIEPGYFAKPTKLHIADLRTKKGRIYVAK
jgi:hypothetical protein